MNCLYVLYDARCGLCAWARRWVEVRETYFEVAFVAAGSERAREMFPGLEHRDDPEELVVVSDGGDVYLGGSAWVMVLYALVDYREWSLRLGSPALLPLARQAFSLISRTRHAAFARIEPHMSDAVLESTLKKLPAASCEIPKVGAAPGLLFLDRANLPETENGRTPSQPGTRPFRLGH